MVTKGKIIDLSNFPKHLLEQRFISVWLDLEVAAGDALIWMLLSVLYKLKYQDKIEKELRHQSSRDTHCGQFW